MANIKKNKTAKIQTKNGGNFSYTYTDLATVNSYIDSIGERYYQYTDTLTSPITGELVDYIYTVRIDKDGNESKPIRGCRIMQSRTTTSGNIAQEYNSGVTYARRYSLCLAYGLATEDDDGNQAGGVQAEISNKTQSQPSQPTQTTQPAQNDSQYVSYKQAKYMKDLGYQGDASKVLKSQANSIITELKKQNGML